MSPCAGSPARWVGWIVAFGDLVAYLVVGVYGFATHGLLDRPDPARFLATLLPFWGTYALIGSVLGAYRQRRIVRPAGLVRAAAAVVLAAPAGAWVRALWLETAVVPVFVGVMAGVALVAVVGWRGLAILALGRRGPAG